MGNQQMAYSSNQQQPPSVEDQNEWYDSVSDVEEHKQQINTPETNVVVNGILDEFIDSLFESKLANGPSPSEALTGHNLPEDQQHSVNQTKPITYDEGALNWKGVDFPPESGCPARLLPNNSQVPPSTSGRTVCENDYAPKESEIKIRSAPQETISKLSSHESKPSKENGTLFSLEQKTNESIDSLKELCLKSDSTVPLPCPEDCEVFLNSEVKESVKAFELTPKDVQTISQSGKFCEVFCGPKEIDSFHETLETIDKYAKENRDCDVVPLDSEGIEELSTSTIIRAGEDILEKTASYLEQISNRSYKENNTAERSISSADSCDPVDLGRNECLDTRKNTIPTYNELNEQCDKQEYKLFKPNALEHLELHLPEELPFPSKNIDSCQKAPLEDATSSNKTVDEVGVSSAVASEYLQDKEIPVETSLSATKSEHLQNTKNPEEIQKPIKNKESECDVITTKQDDAAFTISQTGGLDDISNYDKNNASIIRATDIRQDDTISKGSQQDEPNIKELPLVPEDLATDLCFVETQDSVVKGEEKKLLNCLGSSLNDNATIISSTIPMDAHSSSVVEESFQNCTSALSKSLASVPNDLAESDKPAKITHCDNADDIPSKSEQSNTSVPLLVEAPPYSPVLPEDPIEINSPVLPEINSPEINSEINSPVLPEDPIELPKLLEGIEKPLQQQTECLPQNKETRKTIEISNSVSEILTASIPSTPNEIPSNDKEDAINNAISTPVTSPIGTLWKETECSVGEKYVEVKEHNSNSLKDKIPNCSSPLLEVDERSTSHNNDFAPITPPNDADKVLTSFEEIAKSKSSEKDASKQKHFEVKACDNSNTPIDEVLSSSAPLLGVDKKSTSHSNEPTSAIRPKNEDAVITSLEEIDEFKSFGKDTSKQKSIGLKACDNSNTSAGEVLTSSAPLSGAGEKSVSQDNESISTSSSKDKDVFIAEEIVKFKSLETGAQSPFQNERKDMKLSKAGSQMDGSSSITENVSNSTSANLNDVAPSSVRKETPKTTKGMPRKSSIGVLNIKRKSFSSEAEKVVETKQNDKSNFVASKEEAPHGCTSLPEKENRPPPQCSPAVTPVVTDVICTPTEGRRKSQPSGKEQVENRQHKESRRKSYDVCSQMEKIENSSRESVKETESSVGEKISPETKYYRNFYEEGNICDLDEVINQFRHKHNPDSVQPYSNVDKRKDLLDKLNSKRTTSDVRRNSGKNLERSNLQATGTHKRETILPDIKNKNFEDIPVCLDRQECETSTTSSQNDTREQNSENVLPIDDLVNFRGIIAGENVVQNGPKKNCTDAVKEREKMDATNNSSASVDNKKERMPELKPETLKSLIADLSLNKSTVDVGCNTTEDWTKKDNSKGEAEWLKERKKLIGRITDLHQTQNATKFIVKELIYLVTSWMEGKDKDNVDLQETRQKLINERDQALEDLRSVEESFYELHRRYEKTKKLIEDYKKNEDILKRQIADGEEKLQQQKQMFDHLVKHSEDKLEQANSEILNLGKSKESEMAVLIAQLRKAEMKANSLEKALEQKVRENTELSSICEDLITKCGRK